jgi:hypothetical protein
MNKKRFNIQHRIGKAKHVVNFHNGAKIHGDGSPFYDMRIFKNKKEMNKFIKDLLKKGYTKE